MGSLQKILSSICRGILDSLRGFYLVFTISEHDKRPSRPEKAASGRTRSDNDLNSPPTPSSSGSSAGVQSLRQRLLECCLLNGGVLLCSLLMFQHVLLPLLHFSVRLLFGDTAAATDRVSVWTTLSVVLSCTFSTLWVVPIFFVSRVINCIWFQDIADAAYRSTKGRPSARLGVSVLVADTLFSVFAQALFLIQGTVSEYVLPMAGMGRLVYLVHMCLLYALYAFEYKWYNMGWELHRRLIFIETEWPYFLGFGLPLALVTQAFPSYMMNGCLFSVLFPVFIISGNEAEPVTGVCDKRLQLFTPVIVASNAIFRRSIQPAATSRRR